MKIVLASGSARRREILASLGLTFEVCPSNVDEDVKTGTSPGDAVCELAIRKAAHVASTFPAALILGSDTVIDLDNEIVGKPQDAADARRILEGLSGRAHLVHTGVAVIDSTNGRTEVGRSTTKIGFRRLSASEIESYIGTGEPMDKAGAYAIQGRARDFIQLIDGDEDAVIGLPVGLVVDLLARFGLTTQVPERHSA
ncbi:Maf family protein [Longispora sp. K20-0274]|uniref:Maf family protein n=1 Tax=Longispora sp. K20-0274 TaxID=3088255 RepID=UPI003999F532